MTGLLNPFLSEIGTFFCFGILVVYLGHGSFHPVVVSFFSKSVFGKGMYVLTANGGNLRKKVVINSLCRSMRQVEHGTMKGYRIIVWYAYGLGSTPWNAASKLLVSLFCVYFVAFCSRHSKSLWLFVPDQTRPTVKV